MDDKFYIYEYNECPYCNGNLRDTGTSLAGNQIVQCIECGRIFLEKDIDKIRKELDEKERDTKFR